MKQLLTLALYILAAIGLAWLVLWGCGQLGFPQTPSMIAAGLVAVCVVLVGLNRTGTLNV